MEEDVSTDLSADPPTRLKNPKIFKPFEMFVEMYGLPAYNEMDPTMFIALTYTLMFGIMFGDVGQGICLVVGGFLLYHFKKMNLAAIVSLAGIWSTVFGFMYGSIFGFEDILSPVWMRPMDNIMTTLMLAIGFGMVLILIAMVINIINAIRAKEPGRLLFDQSGVAGLICYGCAATCIVLYETGHALPATSILAVAVGIPLVAIFLKEPLSNLVEHKKHIFPEGSKGMFFVEAFVELFDVVLSYATNSISFVRVGAFALSHAGMMGVVMTLAGYESGSPNWIVVVFGNILVTGLEGLVVGIQVLRLEYYEMFSRFYRGSGKPFHADFKRKKVSWK
jgi:V/A-type H+-transporting ATPase subunit I